MNWESSKMSDLGKVLVRIKDEMPRPMALVIIGSRDCTTFDGVSLRVGLCGICDMRTHGSMPNEPILRDVFQSVLRKNFNIGLEFSEEQLTNRQAQREVIADLKNLGATSVVGIYAKPSPKDYELYLSSTVWNIRNRRNLRALEENPPNPEDFDHLIIVEDD